MTHTTTTTNVTGNTVTYLAVACKWCGQVHTQAGMCPAVKAIEYFKDGTVKRVEFKTVADYWYPYQPFPQPFKPLWPTVTYTSGVAGDTFLGAAS